MKRHTIYVVATAVAAMAIAALCFAGCSSQSSSSQAQEHQSSSDTQNSQPETTQISVLSNDISAQALSEVEQAYVASGHDNVSFSNSTFQGARDFSAQTSEGVDADIIMCASRSEMDQLQDASSIDASTRADTVQDNIVIVVTSSSTITQLSLTDAASGNYRLVMGNETDEIGNDVRQALTTVGGYRQSDGTQGAAASGRGGNYSEALAREGQVTLAATDQEVVNALSQGTADVGFLRESDVYRLGGVKIVGRIDANTHTNVVFPTAVSTDSQNSSAARDFLSWASQDQTAQTIWEKWGFSPVA